MRKAKSSKRGGRGRFAEGAEGTEKCELRGDPDAFGGGAAEGDIAGCGSEGESLVVVAFEETQLCSRTDAAGFEEFEEVAVAFVDSTDGVGGAGSGVGEQKEAAMAAKKKSSKAEGRRIFFMGRGGRRKAVSFRR